MHFMNHIHNTINSLSNTSQTQNTKQQKHFFPYMAHETDSNVCQKFVDRLQVLINPINILFTKIFKTLEKNIHGQLPSSSRKNKSAFSA